MAREREAIIITELPYQVNKARLIEKIADLVRSKKIEGLSDIRDESDREGMRVVLELKRGEDRLESKVIRIVAKGEDYVLSTPGPGKMEAAKVFAQKRQIYRLFNLLYIFESPLKIFFVGQNTDGICATFLIGLCNLYGIEIFTYEPG